MFKLTKFTGEAIWVNPESIKSVEECGDTVVTMNSDEKLLVRESAEEIRRQFMAYKRAILTGGHFTQDSLVAKSSS